MLRWFLTLLCTIVFCSSAMAQAEPVRVVFLSSPTCPFCSVVLERDLVPLQQQYQDRLEIASIDTTTPAGRQILHATWREFSVPENRRGVPTILIGNDLLVGAGEIPERLPRLVEKAGIEARSWPYIEGLQEFLAAAEPQPVVPGTETWRDRFQRDLPGNYISTALLFLMLLLAALLLRDRPWQQRIGERSGWTGKLIVAALGFAVAAYMTYGETVKGELVCGPVGQCNIVQHSDLATIHGVPLALLGALAYATLLFLYLFRKFSASRFTNLVPVVVLVVALPGFAFSILLTFWQPFVIGATCAWCLASALSMSGSLLLGISEGRQLFKTLRAEGLKPILDA